MAENDEEYIIAMLRAKIRDIAGRIDREHPSLARPERNNTIVRLVVDEVQAEFASRPDLEKKLARISGEAFVRSLLA
jgi:hypothetical protein